MIKHRIALFVVAATLLAAEASKVHAQEVLAVEAGRIVSGVADDIENGVLLIKNGKVIDVGKDIEVPVSARVLKFPDAVVVPGFIECHSSAGLRSSNEYVPEVPYISVMDGIDPNSRSFSDALRGGITAIHVIPGNSTRIGGQGAVLRPVGGVVDAMVIKAPSAIKISLLPSLGESRMTHMAALRNAFLSLYNELDRLVPAKPGEPITVGEAGDVDLRSLLLPRPDWKSFDFDKVPEDKIDDKKKPLVDLVRGKIPAFIYCPRAADVFKAFELMDVHGIRGTLVLGPDAHRTVPALAARKDLGPVILDPALELRREDTGTGDERLYETGRIFFDAGVRFAVSARGSSSFHSRTRSVFSRDGASHLWYQAARLVRQGLPRDEALRAITLHPAIILGLEHRMGSIEKGKDANFTVFTGDPLDVRSWVDRVFIEGRQVYGRNEDRDLKELLRQPEGGS